MMKKNEIICVKVKIRIDYSEKSYTESTITMPKEIADNLLCHAMDWRNKWSATFIEVEKYLKAEEGLNKELNKKKI